jgi:hypothetical protein
MGWAVTCCEAGYRVVCTSITVVLAHPITGALAHPVGARQGAAGRAVPNVPGISGKHTGVIDAREPTARLGARRTSTPRQVPPTDWCVPDKPSPRWKPCGCIRVWRAFDKVAVCCAGSVACALRAWPRSVSPAHPPPPRLSSPTHWTPSLLASRRYTRAAATRPRRRAPAPAPPPPPHPASNVPYTCTPSVAGDPVRTSTSPPLSLARTACRRAFRPRCRPSA